MSYRAAGIYNLTRNIRAILKRYRKEPPSLIMHLFTPGFRFGSKDSAIFSYNGDMKHWLDFIREQKMPNEILEILDESGVRFYDGCLIVEVHDHRPIDIIDQPSTNEDQLGNSQNLLHPHTSITTSSNKSKNDNPNREGPQDLPDDQVTLHRLLLSPTCETLWKDLQLMNEARMAYNLGLTKEIKGSEFKWNPMNEEQTVILEAAILERTTPALCLSPSIITSRIANQMLGDTTLQPSTNHKKQRKRPLNSGEEEAMRRKRDRQEKYIHIADESYGQPFAPTFSRIEVIRRLRETPTVQVTQAEGEPHPSTSQQPNQVASATPTHQPNAFNHDPRTGHSTTSELRQSSQAEAYPNSQTNLSTQPSNPHLQPVNPAVANAVISPPSIPASVSVVPPPAKKTGGSKKKTASANNVLGEGTSEAGSPAALPVKKLSKKAQALAEMTPEQRAAAEELRKKKAEQRKLNKERKLAAVAAQNQAQTQSASNTNQPHYGPTNPTTNTSHLQHQSLGLVGQDGNIPVPNSIPVHNPTLSVSQANENGMKIFHNNHGMNVSNSNDQKHLQVTNVHQNKSMNNSLMNTSNPNPSSHHHSIPVPTINSNSIPVPSLDVSSSSNSSSSIPVTMTNSNHKMISNDINNHKNIRIDLNNSIPVPSNQHDINVVGNLINNQKQQQINNMMSVTSQSNEHHSIGIPVIQTPDLNGWSSSIGINSNGFQPVEYANHDSNLNHNHGSEMDIRVHQHQPPSNPSNQFNSNSVGYHNPNNLHW
ncbi:hypothetical protein CROQUDRAFT_660353 [Cronartium quercuum f. sp. fusiforme G11]|uniref:Spt20-like SEP domain-containing protein n=1 Tax=Cronartium quercuum f. sp. fusiforme G11 TaxID=708437 RepID=A0A9P6NHF6_9BASI|nr:hypothetical protein CROQUDRAFT_660353 [Cronartium quercuum f. sp. fusiforme G11]